MLISPVGGFASQYWKLTYRMRIKAPLLKFARRFGRTSKHQPPAAWMPPSDPLWAALLGVTMAEHPRIGVSRASEFGAAELRAIKVPALLLIGEQERLYELQAILKLAQARMPGLRGAIVPGADHIAALAQLEEVNARIIEFLR